MSASRDGSDGGIYNDDLQELLALILDGATASASTASAPASASRARPSTRRVSLASLGGASLASLSHFLSIGGLCRSAETCKGLRSLRPAPASAVERPFLLHHRGRERI